MRLRDILFERTMKSLVSVTSSNFGRDREQRSTRVQVKNITYIPSVQQRLLKITAKTQTDPNELYDSIILLSNVEYIDDSRYNFLQQQEEAESEQYNAFKFRGVDGSDYYASYDRVKSLDVRVACGCEDFFWRFAAFNHKDNSLHGDPPPPYVRKTKTRPPANPNKTPGVCKHLMKLKEELDRERFFKELLN